MANKKTTKKFYIKGTNESLCKSTRDYAFAVVANSVDGKTVLAGCRSQLKDAIGWQDEAVKIWDAQIKNWDRNHDAAWRERHPEANDDVLAKELAHLHSLKNTVRIVELEAK